MKKSNNKSILDKVPETKANTNTAGLEEGLFEAIPDDIKLIPEKTQKILNKDNLSDYKRHRAILFRWALREGKNPEKKKGYSVSTMKVHAYRLDRFYRYVWEARGEYTTEVTPEDAERYINLLAETDDNRSHKSKCVQSVLILFKWRRYELDEEEVDIDNPFSSGGEDGIKDYLSKTEMRKIRNSAYEYGRIPTEDKTEEEIDELRTHLSQRFGKSKDGLSIEDCRSWKVPSLVEVSLEAGLRPCEVERASVDWVNEENMKLRIPKEDSAKNRNYWDVALTEETTNTLQKWLKERDSREMYEDTDLIWLTRKGNPYQSQSLRRLIHRLFETADISKEGRQTSWYILRHSAGTHIYEEGGLNHVSEQLRHLGFDTSLRYVHSPISERRSSIKPMLTDDRKPSRTPNINPLLLKQSSIG